jgi:electron transport complex protein RnfB
MIGEEVLILTGLVVAVTASLAWVRKRYPATTAPLVEAIDAVLPQTQCAQCGYPGCRPYAEAVARGESIDLCPPGGAETQRQLAALLGRSAGPPLATPRPVRAVIDESRCIGCFLCVDACPVDAIVGAPRFMHTVIEARCTGCELCLPPCPVDCIDLIPLEVGPPPTEAQPAPSGQNDCIRCGRCDPVCPEGLPVEQLWWVSRGNDLGAAVESGIGDCIECGLCNAPCPAGIDLVGTFVSARARLADQRRAEKAALIARAHVGERDGRLAREAARKSDRRQARLAALKAGQRPDRSPP